MKVSESTRSWWGCRAEDIGLQAGALRVAGKSACDCRPEHVGLQAGAHRIAGRGA